MALELRAQAAHDAHRLNTRDWGEPVVLIAPDGAMYATDAETGGTLRAVQILSDRREETPGTGNPQYIDAPVVTLSTRSLHRVPKDGERWGVKFELTPGSTAELMLVSRDRARHGGGSLGLIRLYPYSTREPSPEGE